MTAKVVGRTMNLILPEAVNQEGSTQLWRLPQRRVDLRVSDGLDSNPDELFLLAEVVVKQEFFR
jgi:hypothetical protein